MTDKNLFHCKDCRFHVPLQDPRQYACHYGPPANLIVPDRSHGFVIRAAWPTVSMHDSCGAGEPKTTVGQVAVPTADEFTGGPLVVGGPVESIEKSRKN